MSGSQQPHHQNPDYYAETASLYGEHGQQKIPPPQYQEYMHQQYPPPPGPPPASQGEYAPPKPPRSGQQQQQYQQQDYYPPPPAQGQGYSPQQPSPGNTPVPQPPVSGGDNQGFVDSSKPTFGERLYQWSTKASVPINKVTNRLGSEAFWPSTMEIECDKAARILKSFCSPKGKPRVLVKIPQRAIETAAGLAVFTTFRTGLHISGAGGSGVVVARLPDGSWSPPSGFLVHTLGAGFMIGLDIYDCVCVLRTPEAVAAFTSPRISLGGEIGLVAGPVGAGAAVDAALLRSAKPVWSYMKSRGLYAGVQADGTIIIARPDANAAFYGVKGVKVGDILRGQVPTKGPPGMWPEGARQLMEVLKSAEGRRDVDEGVLKDVSSGPTPGDLGLDDKGHQTGVYVPDGKHPRYA
ncbi:hypothetical protein VSDG_09178 [Cytospora chrysosperma]|uniref:Ysc84 actin-binding domain-containing protein n=1 Tax=Cytospora chrysosperma TaxID=252740 RepID=A0A423VAR5_CYTCH|nr:hypothetical protein VSDG_09178 [Valsa sordida]